MNLKVTSFLLPILLITDLAVAQTPRCDRTKTFADCYQAFDTLATASDPEIAAAAKAKGAEVGQELAVKATSSIAPNTGRGLLDLLPTFASNLGINGLKKTNGDLTFDRRFVVGQWRVSFKGTAFVDAKLFEPLRQKLPEAIRDTRSKDLNQQIGDFDQVDYQVTASREKATGEVRFGRDPGDYEDLFKDFLNGQIQNTQQRLVDWAASASDRIRLSPDEENLSPDGLLLSTPIGKLVQDRKLTEQDVLDIEATLRPLTVDINQRMRNTDLGTDLLDELINNQPQWLIDAKYEDRDALTGADKRSASTTFELPLAGNVNRYLSWARTSGDAACANGKGSLSCLRKYKDTFLTGIAAGQRLTVSLAYTDTRRVHFELPADSFVFDQAGGEKWVGSLVYGRYFPNFRFFDQQVGGNTNQGTRVDLEAKYEEPVDSNGMLKSRLVATLTFTQGMTINTGMSFSIVYANKPEFLGEVDQKVSANLGFRWKTGAAAAN